MTKRPKLYSRHRHQWQPTLIPNQVTCTVCGFTVPATVVRTPPEQEQQ